MSSTLQDAARHVANLLVTYLPAALPYPPLMDDLVAAMSELGMRPELPPMMNQVRMGYMWNRPRVATAATWNIKASKISMRGHIWLAEGPHNTGKCRCILLPTSVTF